MSSYSRSMVAATGGEGADTSVEVRELKNRQSLIDDGVIVPAKRPRKLPGKQIAMAPGPSITEVLEHERR